MELKKQVNHKKVFSIIGLSLAVSSIVCSCVAILCSKLLHQVTDNELAFKVANVIILWGIGLPIFLLITKNLPNGEKRESKKLSIGAIIKLCLIILSLTTIFSTTSGIFKDLILSFKGPQVSQAKEVTLTIGFIVQSLLFSAIIPPIMEEIMFRKFMLNKLTPYGDKIAMIITGIAFGLYHCNFEQDFYGPPVGIVLGYVALKTGGIKYTIILHMFINTLTCVTEFIGIGSPNSAGIVSLGLVILAVVGLIVLIINLKKVKLSKGEITLEKGTAFKVTCMNVGMILYFISCIGWTLYWLL